MFITTLRDPLASLLCFTVFRVLRVLQVRLRAILRALRKGEIKELATIYASRRCRPKHGAIFVSPPFVAVLLKLFSRSFPLYQPEHGVYDVARFISEIADDHAVSTKYMVEV